MNADAQTILHQFAVVVADAYVNQYVDPEGRKVMNYPVVYYNRKTKTFDWCSSLTPLSEDEVNVETLELNIYGETSNDPEIAREAIEKYIISFIDYTEFFWKIEPETEEE